MKRVAPIDGTPGTIPVLGEVGCLRPKKRRKKKWEEGLKVNMNKLTATEHKCKELTDGSLACHRPAHGKVLTVYSVLTTGGPNATGLPRASYR